MLSTFNQATTSYDWIIEIVFLVFLGLQLLILFFLRAKLISLMKDDICFDYCQTTNAYVGMNGDSVGKKMLITDNFFESSMFITIKFLVLLNSTFLNFVCRSSIYFPSP